MFSFHLATGDGNTSLKNLFSSFFRSCLVFTSQQGTETRMRSFITNPQTLEFSFHLATGDGNKSIINKFHNPLRRLVQFSPRNRGRKLYTCLGHYHSEHVLVFTSQQGTETLCPDYNIYNLLEFQFSPRNRGRKRLSYLSVGFIIDSSFSFHLATGDRNLYKTLSSKTHLQIRFSFHLATGDGNLQNVSTSALYSTSFSFHLATGDGNFLIHALKSLKLKCVLVFTSQQGTETLQIYHADVLGQPLFQFSPRNRGRKLRQISPSSVLLSWKHVLVFTSQQGTETNPLWLYLTHLIYIV